MNLVRDAICDIQLLRHHLVCPAPTASSPHDEGPLLTTSEWRGGDLILDGRTLLCSFSLRYSRHRSQRVLEP